MARVDHSGRNKGEARHTRLPHLMTGSPAWRDLSGNAVKVLVALQRLDRGPDNGNLFFGARKATDETGFSRNTVMRALRELEDHGFIAAVERGHFQVKGGPATRWRLTFISAPAIAGPATNDWQRWQAHGNKTRAQDLTFTGSKFEHEIGNAAPAGSKFAPITTETSHVSTSAAGSNIEPQVVCHRQGAEQACFQQRKHANFADGDFFEPIDAETLSGLRERATAHIKSGGVGAQTRLAETAKIPGGTLSKFLAGKGLNGTHFVGLQLALMSADRKAA